MRVIAALFLAIVIAGCSIGSGTTTAPTNAHLSGTTTAGPTCPVVQEGIPCPDQPVAGATIEIRDLSGEVVAEAVTDDSGGFAVDLPPGLYRLVPQVMDGLMGTAEAVDVTLVADATTVVNFSYDTGIR